MSSKSQLGIDKILTHKFKIPWSEDLKYQGDPYEVIEEAIKQLPEYKHERTDQRLIDFAKQRDKMNKPNNGDIIAGSFTIPDNRINIYTCASGHDTITRDLDHGTTPMFLACKTCGKQATSHMYRCDQTLTPLWEWYAPNPVDCADYEMDHVLSGGLLLRPVSDAQPSNKQLSQEVMKVMYKFQKDFKHKNPGFTQRQFKRAFLKKFPNLLS